MGGNASSTMKLGGQMLPLPSQFHHASMIRAYVCVPMRTNSGIYLISLTQFPVHFSLGPPSEPSYQWPPSCLLMFAAIPPLPPTLFLCISSL